MVYFDDCDLIGCSVQGNYIVVDNVKYLICKAEARGLWVRECK